MSLECFDQHTTILNVSEIWDNSLLYTDYLNALSVAISECTALASMKFHGTVVATMCGVPSIVMIATNKNRNFMKRIGRGDLLSNFADPRLSELVAPTAIPIDPSAVAGLRRRAQEVLVELREGIATVTA